MLETPSSMVDILLQWGVPAERPHTRFAFCCSRDLYLQSPHGYIGSRLYDFMQVGWQNGASATATIQLSSTSVPCSGQVLVTMIYIAQGTTIPVYHQSWICSTLSSRSYLFELLSIIDVCQGCSERKSWLQDANMMIWTYIGASKIITQYYGRYKKYEQKIR